MARARPKVFDFSRGLQTKALDDGQPLPEFREFNDVRVDRGVAKVRPGMARLLDMTSLNGALDFEATSTQYAQAEVDPRVWTLGTKWTLEVLYNLETITSGTFLYVGTTTPSLILDLNSSKLRLRVYDSGATLTTVSTAANVSAGVQSVQIVRDGASLTIRTDNAVEDTGSMSATNALRAPVGDIHLGADATPGTYLDGVVDYIRLFDLARDNHNDRLIRFADPRADYVLADYDMNITANAIVKDRSRYENSLLGVAGNLPTDATALCHQSAPVNGITYYVDTDGKKYALVVAGGQAFHVEM